MKRRRWVESVVWIGLVLSLHSVADTENTITPIDIEFRRKAVRRLVFDQDQFIPLCVFKPEKVVNLSVEYPEAAHKRGQPMNFRKGVSQ